MVALTAPPPGMLGAVRTIGWSASDDVGVRSIDVFVSRHGPAGPFATIVSGLANTGAYDWTVTPALSDSVTFKVVARFTALSPVPARGRLSIEYVIPRAGHVEVTLFDLHGRAVENILDAERPAGRGAVVWSTSIASRRLRPGIYLIRLSALGSTDTRRLVVLGD